MSSNQINKVLIKPVTNTIYGVDLQTCQLRGIPYPIRQNTTLNEKLNILPTVRHSADTYPRQKYFCIGNKGHKSSLGNGDVEITTPLQHKPTDSSLFGMLPFVVRELNNDLTPQQRERFALRQVKEFNGRNYIVYWLRRIDDVNTGTNLIYYTTRNNGVTVETTKREFVPSRTNQNPIPEPLRVVDTNSLDGDYVRCESVIQLRLTEWDLEEIINAANIVHGSYQYAIISEIGLVSAVDRTVTAESPNGATSFNYKEVVSAQINTFIATDFRPYFANSDVTLSLATGSSEPMFSLVAP